MSGRASRHLLFYCLLVALPYGIWGITASGQTPALDRLISFLYGFTNGLLVTFLLLAFSYVHKIVFLILGMVLNFLSYTTALITVFYNLYFGYPLSSASLIVILETNSQEAGEFMASFSLLNIILLIVAFCIVHIVLIKLTVRLSNNVYNTSWKTRAIVMSILGLTYTVCILKNDLLFQDNMFFALRDTYANYNEERQLLAQQQSDPGRKTRVDVTRPDIRGPETYILVIGEALSRHHMSLYGYRRKTNPELEKIRDELMVFTDVISSDNTTVLCLKKVLTFANCEDMSPLTTEPGLLELMNAAGFKTHWISNQCYSGTHDTWATLFSNNAHEKHYTNFVNSINSNPVYDEVVLDPLQKALADTAQKKFIIVHLIGSHKRADFRYPAAFMQFSSLDDQPLTCSDAGLFDKRYVNAYDNSVLYNDHVMNEIIRMTRSKGQRSFVLYFPDHGEEVCERTAFSGHANGVNSPNMVEIPMVLWRSEKFRRSRQLDSTVVTRPYQTDDVIHSLLDLMQISCRQYVREKSVFDPAFKPEKRMVEGRYDYDELFGDR